MGSVAARWNLGCAFVRDMQEPGGVALGDDEVAERCGEAFGVVEAGAVFAANPIEPLQSSTI